MSRAPAEPLRRATHVHVRAVTEAIHAGMVGWVRGAMDDAGLHHVQVLDHFPASVEAPAIVLYSFRMGPEKMLDHNDPGCSLMGGMSAAEEALIPKPWRDLGALMSETLQSMVPDEKRGGRVVPSRRPLVSELPPLLAAWYESREPAEGWVVDAPDGRRGMIPNLWWHATFPVDVQYMLCGLSPGGAEAGLSVLLPALTAVRTAVHLRGVLELTLPAVPCVEELWPFLYALLGSIDDDNLDAPEPEDLEAAIDAARQPFQTQVGVVPSQHVEDGSLFLLMSALGRPLYGTLCLRVRAGIAARVGFEPGGDFAPNVARR